MYRAVGLLRPDTNFTVEEAHQRLAAAFPGYSVARTGDRIDVAKGDWWLAVAKITGDYVSEETNGLVGHLAGVEPDEADALVRSGSRVEMWTDVPDPFMEHFNDYLSAVSVLKSFTGLLAVDPKERNVL